MDYSLTKFRLSDRLAVAPVQFITPSDETALEINGFYPRGFRVLTGGTLTLWVPDTSTAAKRIDIGTVADGFEWKHGGFVAIAATAEDGETATTADNILAIP